MLVELLILTTLVIVYIRTGSIEYLTIWSIFACIMLILTHKNMVMEHLQVSSEAIQNVGSIYNQDKIIIKDLDVNGTFNMIPKGIIVAWNGTVAPTGWALCNGANGTPDLRGRFIICAGQGAGLTNRNFAARGGAETVTLSVYEMPAHGHSLNKSLYVHQRSFKGEGGSDRPLKDSSGDDYGLTTTATGGGRPHENMPPYYALAYIMKL